ncbi:hypothetical protein [Cribrihabitans pelagius]|uniref:hypothetical protein n=1 Tax=Cribrihabitans pelagius TaxID=1765746 RepID=UPI003B5AB410
MPKPDQTYFSSGGRRLVRRDPRQDPKMANCPIALQRICGTCSGFPPDAAIRAKAQPCATRQVYVDGSRCAASCTLWSRKSAPVSPIAQGNSK